MTPVQIRVACPDDRLKLAEMFLRCSIETRYRRFHGFLESIPEPYFTEALGGRPGHFALVAATPATIVALASCAEGELGILVEDAYQRQGIGSRLLETLMARGGYGAFLASVQPDQAWIVPFLRRYSQIKIEFT
ncbi:MAG: GNAT family N-acetyltransferase [Streptosporangiaceae bacterium]|nr:GNAT family N-acetyltransferase [Streptosporangiaceae bacterium]